MAQLNHTPRLLEAEVALTVLFCLIDDAYTHLNPRALCYESLKHLSDSEVVALLHSSSSCGACKANAPFCGTQRGSSPTRSLGWWGSAPFLVP